MEAIAEQRPDNDLIGESQMKATFDHVVDYIMAKRVGPTGKVEYLVKWEGWHERTATWEPPANFASPQVIEIFEEGLRQEMGLPEPSLEVVDQPMPFRSPIMKRKYTKSGAFKRKKCSEPKASNFLEDIRKRSKKLKPNTTEMSTNKLFDVEVNKRIERVIKRFEPLVGASKRKSRMSCPSSPIKVKPSPPKPVSDRSQRYSMRHQKTSHSISDNSVSNSSLEENKNPSGVNSKIKTPKSSKNRQMKVNNDSNKMVHKLSQNLFSETVDDFSSESQDCTFDQNVSTLEESPSKIFIDKVKERFSPFPEQYNKFLNSIIEFQTINLEFNKLLNNNEELISDFFDILFINRERQKKDSQLFDEFYPIKSDEQIEEEILQWFEKLDEMLESDQKREFWSYIQNKGKTDVLKASPDYLWLRIDKMLSSHPDLSEEFKMFMPTLCSKIYHLYSKH